MPFSDHPAVKLCEEVLESIRPQYKDMQVDIRPSSNIPAMHHAFIMYKVGDTWWDCSFTFDVRELGLTFDEFMLRAHVAISRSIECKPGRKFTS